MNLAKLYYVVYRYLSSTLYFVAQRRAPVCSMAFGEHVRVVCVGQLDKLMLLRLKILYDTVIINNFSSLSIINTEK